MSIKVLFVCLGNICRSPMAEGIFQHLVDKAGLTDHIQVDSAGTGSWHVGERAHRGTRQVLKAHGIHYNGRARQVISQDMAHQKSWIIAMDSSNVANLRQRFGNQTQIHLLLDFSTKYQQKDVPDPYYSGNFGFAYDLVLSGCEGLLEKIKANL